VAYIAVLELCVLYGMAQTASDNKTLGTDLRTER